MKNRFKQFSILILGIPLFLFIGVNISLADGWSEHTPDDINLRDSPGTVNAHYNSGGRRIVRINNTTIALAPKASISDYTYRSTDNGASWTRIDTDGRYSGCLISGPNEMVYHFYVSGDYIYMVRFKYNETPPAPIRIYYDPNLSEQGHGAYNMLNATVDADGTLYVATHWDDQSSGGGDTLYLIGSEDGGSTWTPEGNAYVIRQGSSSHSWGYIHLDVTSGNVLVSAYCEWGGYSIQFAKSYDKGANWTHTQAGSNMSNASILTVGENTIYIFAQTGSSPPQGQRGLAFNKSIDLGNTWTGWSVIDGTSLSGYADPSPGLGRDGAIYVAYRSGARPDLAGVYGGNGCRERLARSTNDGNSWTFPDDYFYDAYGNRTERTGTRSQIRYQTWWNYGGPLEWIWMQYVNNGSQHTIHYDINSEVSIYTYSAFDSCDLNHDSSVNITDVVICVNVILGSETNPDYIARAQGVAAPTDAVNILDLMGIINEILG